jgi:hypothetical protein
VLRLVFMIIAYRDRKLSRLKSLLLRAPLQQMEDYTSPWEEA